MAAIGKAGLQMAGFIRCRRGLETVPDEGAESIRVATRGEPKSIDKRKIKELVDFVGT